MEIKPAYLALAAVALAALYVSMKGAKNTASDFASSIVGTVADVADGVVSGTVETIGQAFGIPTTSKPYAITLMDQWSSADWYDKAALSFKISAALPLSDYLKWLGDSSYRPTI